jgi:diguanylate cyclase
VHWFYLVSMPILFSNMAYVVFAMALLEITPAAQPRLHRATLALLGVLAGFALAGIALPRWSLEFDRYGVGLMTTYGLVAAVIRARQGHSSAQWYLVAISAFFVLGGASISLSRVAVNTLYVEHLGLLAVVVEAALLALVLAHQFSLLHNEKAHAERRAREGFDIAHRDSLTGLPNRYSLEKALKELPLHGSLTFIDLDGLKLYNDRYGHSKGDELLCGFAKALQDLLGKRAQLYRLSGDEFAVTSEPGDIEFVSKMIEDTVSTLRAGSFGLAGASYGSVLVSEDPSRENLKHIADTRMYENKRTRRASSSEEWVRDAHIFQAPKTRSSRPRG